MQVSRILRSTLEQLREPRTDRRRGPSGFAIRGALGREHLRGRQRRRRAGRRGPGQDSRDPRQRPEGSLNVAAAARRRPGSPPGRRIWRSSSSRRSAGVPELRSRRGVPPGRPPAARSGRRQPTRCCSRRPSTTARSRAASRTRSTGSPRPARRGPLRGKPVAVVGADRGRDRLRLGSRRRPQGARGRRRPGDRTRASRSSGRRRPSTITTALVDELQAQRLRGILAELVSEGRLPG